MLKVKNKTMPTKLLREKIDSAINNLLPCFEVTEMEFKKFKKPYMRRILKPDEYEGHPRTVPAYSYIENFFYFPLKDPGYSVSIFSQEIIYHEVSHYIHNQINPKIVKGDQIFLKTGKFPPGHKNLTQLVAEYGNFILNFISINQIDKYQFLKEQKEIYDKYGPEFLPCLARMSLEEAIKREIIKPSKS